MSVCSFVILDHLMTVLSIFYKMMTFSMFLFSLRWFFQLVSLSVQYLESLLQSFFLSFPLSPFVSFSSLSFSTNSSSELPSFCLSISLSVLIFLSLASIYFNSSVCPTCFLFNLCIFLYFPLLLSYCLCLF